MRSFFPGNLFWGSFTNHNTGNYLRHGINITTNQRLSPTFRGNGNTIIVGDSQTSPLPIFPEGGGGMYTGYNKCVNVVLISHVICQMASFFLRKILNNWQTGNGPGKERNQVITFFSFILNTSNTQSQSLLRDFAKYSRIWTIALARKIARAILGG